MIRKSLPAFALAFLFLLALSALAQDKSGNISASKLPATPAAALDTGDKIGNKTANPLALTDTEKYDLANLLSRYNQADQILTARLRVALAIECQDCEEDYAIGLAIADARKFYREQVKPAQAAYLKRREEIQQAHDCLGCELKDGAFVRVPKAEAK